MARERRLNSAELFRSSVLLRFTVVAAFVGGSLPAAVSGALSPERSVVWGLSPERSLVFGPGLNPAAVLPVRYFFIQAVSAAGENLTSSPGNSDMSRGVFFSLS